MQSGAALDGPSPPGVAADRDPGEERRAAAATTLGIAVLWSGDLPQAQRLLDEGLARATRAGLRAVRLEAAAHGALAAAWRGRLRRTEEYAAVALSLGAERTGDPRGATSWQTATAPALAAMSWAATERGDVDTARRWATLARRVGGADPVACALAVAADARSRVATGDVGQVRGAVAVDAPGRGAGRIPALAGHHRALVASALAMDGAGEAAVRVLLHPDDDEVTEPEIVVHAGLLLAGGRPDEARELAKRLRRPDAAQGHLPELVESWVIDCAAADALGQRDEAGGALATAMSLARPEGLRRPFVRWAAALAPILGRAGPGEAVDERPEPAAQAGTYAAHLTAREQAVLRGLAGPRSAAGIAADLSLSLNTVKTHLRSVYRKLGVARRPEAVRRARELHLI